MEQEYLRQELRLEQAAHRETQGHLQRATRAAQYWAAEADRLKRGDPMPTPNPIPIPSTGSAGGPGAGGGVAGVCGGEVIELVLATLACLSRLGEALLSDEGELEPGALTRLSELARWRAERLHATLLALSPSGATPLAALPTHQHQHA